MKILALTLLVLGTLACRTYTPEQEEAALRLKCATYAHKVARPDKARVGAFVPVASVKGEKDMEDAEIRRIESLCLQRYGVKDTEGVLAREK